ncbi:MAG: DUF4035 domain-containing protein [Chloroflexota bacterium]
MEPIGEQRADWRSALVAAIVANSTRDPKKRRKPFQPKDFMPDYEKGINRQPADWRAMKQLAKMLHEAYKKKD